MRWRSIVLAILAIGFGITAGVCIEVVIRLETAISAIYSGDANNLTAAQIASAAAMQAQGTALYLLTGPLVVGSLICLVGFLVVLAWRWQSRRSPEQN